MIELLIQHNNKNNRIILRVIYFIIFTAVIFLMNSCDFGKNQPKEKSIVTHRYDADGKIKDAINTFVDSLAKRKWPEKLIKDQEINFQKIFDTFYIKSNKYYKDLVYVKFGNSQYNDPLLYQIHKKRIKYNQMSGNDLDYPSFIFNCQTQFIDCSFNLDENYPSLNGIKFKSHVSFINNIFPDSTVFQSITFEKGVIFFNKSLNSYSPKFYNCNFSKGIDFSRLDLVFVQTPMYDIISAQIKSYTFNNKVIFSKCNIKGTLSLKGCKFNDNSSLLFDDVSIPDTLDLSEVKISGRLQLPDISTQREKICYINLINADIDKIIFRYDNYKLVFPNQGIKVSNDLISSTYERLLNNFKTIGFSDSYEKLDIEYSEWKSKSNWIYKITDYWWKFGYQKWRILIFAMFFILIFSIFNFIYYNELQEVYPVEKLYWGNINYSVIRIFNFFRKFFATFIFTSLIFFRLGIDFKVINFKPMRFAVIIIIQYIIGLVCTGFLLNWIL